jgi:predicted PurR-regulated permease PerM
MVARNGRVAGAGTRRADGRRYLTIAIMVLTLWVTRSFLIPLAWAAVLAITIWPLMARAAARWRLPKWALPLAFTIGTGVVLMLPLAIAAIEAAQDSRIALAWLGEAQRHGIPQPSWMTHLPLVGRDLAAWWQLYVGTPQATGNLLGRIDGGAILGMTGRIGAQVARGSMLFLVTLLALFALLRHGQRLGAQAGALAAHFLGGLGNRFTERLVMAVRGTMAGTVLVALGEGTLIGAGYALAGVPRPFLFAVLTIAFAMLPFGAWVIFTLATIVLLVNGAIVAAALLFGASVAIMLIGDNIVQPALIGNAIRLPFLLALVGTFGGLETFGLVGLFLGPVLMAMLLLVWHEAMDGAAEPAARPDQAG